MARTSSKAAGAASARNGKRPRAAAAADVAGVEAAAVRLAAGGNERAAAGEQMRLATERIALGIDESATAAQELARSQRSVAETAVALQQGADANSATAAELAGSIGGIVRDT